VDAALVDAVHDHGLVIHPYTVNEPADLDRMAALGVDGVFTDFPDRAARFRSR
jgi:glycerophosphoryl diester phosphodiesterase